MVELSRQYGHCSRRIEEDGYIYGKEIRYADLDFAAIMVWIQWKKEEDFKKPI